MYRLDDGAAQTSGEALDGIARLQALRSAAISDQNPASASAHSTPIATNNIASALTDYLDLVASFNASAARGGMTRQRAIRSMSAA